MFGIQAVDLRTKIVSGHYDSRKNLSPKTCQIYESVLKIIGVSPSAKRPYVFNDNEQSLDEHIMKLATDLDSDSSVGSGGILAAAVQDICDSLKKHKPM